MPQIILPSIKLNEDAFSMLSQTLINLIFSKFLPDLLTYTLHMLYLRKFFRGFDGTDLS